MNPNRRRNRHRLPLAIALLLALAVAGTWFAQRARRVPPPPAATPESGSEAPRPFRLSDLAPPPEWSGLAVYHGTIRRAEFEYLLTQVFTVGEGWRKFIEIGNMAASIETAPGTRFVLRFAADDEDLPVPRRWRPAAKLGLPPFDKPLADLRIAIDPGHLGGPWARMEERWFSVDGAPPVCEGDLTLTVAKLLQPRLEALGAKVSLVRTGPAPVTSARPETIEAAIQAGSEGSDPLPLPAAADASPRQLAERLFYRTAEIRARADLVNNRLQPDLVLCLHFNAEAWGDPAKPSLVDKNHLHLLLAGALTDEEAAMPDQRFELLRKLLQRTHAEEASVCTTVAEVFAKAANLPPYEYDAGSPRARKIQDNPYLWARNLLANRLYACPVVFLEPYVMNSPDVHARIQAGDYEGSRASGNNPVPRPSIFREYADAVAAGLARHYRIARHQRAAF